MMSSGLSAGFLLDRQWHWLRGEMETTKKPALLTLARLLEEAGVRRLQDLSDAQALLEANPDLARHLRPEERDVLDRLPK